MSAPAATSPAVDEPVELLRLLRDPHSKQLIVEVDGKRYAKLADVGSKAVGQYILKLVAHLLAFTNGMIVTDAGVKSAYQPKNIGVVPEPMGAPAPRTTAPPTTRLRRPAQMKHRSCHHRRAKRKPPLRR